MTKQEKTERLNILQGYIQDGTLTIEDLFLEKNMFHPFLQDYIIQEYNKKYLAA